MASPADVKLTKNVWKNLTAAISALITDVLLVQNTGNPNVRVTTSIAEPITILGFTIRSVESARAEPLTSESVWGIALGGDSSVHVEVLP